MRQTRLWAMWVTMVAGGTAFWLLVFCTIASAYTSFTITPGVVDATHGAPLTYTVTCGTVKGGPYPIVGIPVNALPPPAPTNEPFAQVIPVGTASGTYFCVAKATNATADSGNSPEITLPFTPPSTPVLTVQ